MIKLYEIEMRRSNITPKSFYTACKKAFEKHGVDLKKWVESYEDWEAPNTYKMRNTSTSTEIYKIQPFKWHIQSKGNYNFVMEFDFWDEKQGYGYLYAVEIKH